MAWTELIDIYCERLGDAYWAEPLNALSNVSFLVAALLAFKTARQLRVDSLDTRALIVLAGLVGIGSFLFHTFANAWSALADVIPIWTFVALFTLAAIRRIGGVPVHKVILFYALPFVILAALAMTFASGEGTPDRSPDPLNGSGQYLPAVLALAAFSFVAWKRRNPMTSWIWAASLTFVVSLLFRTVDMALCDIWAYGTHFVWHLLNGLMIWILLDGYIKIQANSQTR